MALQNEDDNNNILSLRDRWTHLYASHLPALALARDPAQSHWPVHLDHCFARIILDNAVGVDKPWTRVVKAPAVRNMTVVQLRDALALGEKVANGQVDLVDLDCVSLRLRGMRGKEKKQVVGRRAVGDGVRGGVKRQAADGEISKYFAPTTPTPAESPSKRVKTEPASETGDGRSASKGASRAKQQPPDTAEQISRINSSSSLTPFRKHTLSLLCCIPPGRWSTYQAMSDHISATSHKTCARAVGNAMRNNPFAPEVPCHRILSSDGSIGGFGGHWGEEGRFAGKKRELLRGEGVVFDSRGKVKGVPFREFGGW